MIRRPARLGASLAVAVAGCQHKPATVQPQPTPHYVVGAAWQGEAGAWFYPREEPSYQATGLAVVEGGQGGRLTADGEPYDPTIVAAAHQTLQLPSAIEVTDLENGRRLLVRVNDRGPPQQGRILALTPAAARLLDMPAGRPTRVRIELDGDRSRSLADTVSGAPSLQILAAPVGAVDEQALPAPGSSGGTDRLPPAASPAVRAPAPMAANTAPLPMSVAQGVPDPGMLWIDAGQFSRRLYADQIAAATGGSVTVQGQGRQTTYGVRLGPYQTTSAADAALDQARHAGVTGARIIVE